MTLTGVMVCGHPGAGLYGTTLSMTMATPEAPGFNGPLRP
jgi:hypothetical protein